MQLENALNRTKPLMGRGGVLQPLEKNYIQVSGHLRPFYVNKYQLWSPLSLDHFCFWTSSFSYKMIAVFVLLALSGPVGSRETHFLELHSPLA